MISAHPPSKTAWGERAKGARLCSAVPASMGGNGHHFNKKTKQEIPSGGKGMCFSSVTVGRC